MGQAMGQIRRGQFDSRLTPLAVRRLSKPGLHADGNGLYLRISEGGGRAWLLFVHVQGKRREMGLGSVKLYNLAEARERARKYRQMADAGKDPIAERDKEEAANAAELVSRRTFKECAVEYVRLHEAQWRNAKFKKDWPASLESYVYPTMGDTDIRHILKADVLEALEPIWHTKTETATRVKSRIRMVLEWAAARGYCTPEPRLWVDVVASLPKASKIKKVQHYPAAAYTDVPDIVAKVDASAATDTIKAAFSFMILTAARSGEVRNATWDEIDQERRTWTIPGEKMKRGREHRVPLSDAAMAIVNSRTRTENEEHDLVFPKPSGKAFSDMAFTALLRRLKIPSTTPGKTATMHGFRSSFRDWASEETNTAHDIVEAALAHVRGDATVQAYARSDLFGKRRELMGKWARFVIGC
jgi:integrase